MRERVKESGKSEGPAVMEGIVVATVNAIMRVAHPQNDIGGKMQNTILWDKI